MKTAIEKLFGLSGKVALVTGGAMGIGRGIALRLAEAGASVMVVDLASPAEARETLEEIRAAGVGASYIQADLRDIPNLSRLADQTVEQLGGIDILVNNAGIFNYCPVTEISEELWDRTVDLNLKAVAFLSKAVIRKMIELGHGGTIINVSSTDSMKPTGNLAHYDSSKGGVHMLTRALAKEAAAYGIRVNEIAPGGVQTPGVMKIAGPDLTPEQMAAMQEQTSQFLKRLPLGRMGEPAEIGSAALFLAGEASSYMTGSTLVADGGLLLM